MSRNYRIPNPLKAAEDVWKKAAGPTNMPGNPVVKQGPPIQLAGTKKKLKKKKYPESRIDR